MGKGKEMRAIYTTKSLIFASKYARGCVRELFTGRVVNNLSDGVPKVGEFAECVHAFEQRDVNTFAGICGDSNPLHIDPGTNITLFGLVNVTVMQLTPTLPSFLSQTLLRQRCSKALSCTASWCLHCFPHSLDQP